MASKRFIVTEITGYTITPTSSYGGSSKPQPSYSVLDTYDNYREVGTYYTSAKHRAPVNERLAYALARELNRKELDDNRHHKYPHTTTDERENAKQQQA